jgi:hypothetical protein
VHDVEVEAICVLVIGRVRDLFVVVAFSAHGAILAA